MFTNEFKDAAGPCTALSFLAKHGGMRNAARVDEHVQKLWRGGPENLLQELQSSRDHIVVPVLCVV